MAAFHSEWHRRNMRGGCPRDQDFASAIWREAPGRRKLREWRRYAVAQGYSTMPCTPRAEIERRAVGDFYIGVASVLAIVLSAAIGITATIALGKNPLGPDRVLANAAGTQRSADDYVEGLAKLGITKIGCFRHAPQSPYPPTCSQDGQ